MNQGLIGNWSPGIGDPSLGGWLTVLLYAVAAGLTWGLLRQGTKLTFQRNPNERWFWRMLFAGLIVLGVNKQLDLQSALTEVGRILAHRQGWYNDRRQFQIAFIAGFAIMGVTLFAAAVNMTWGAPAATRYALVGSTGLVLFVVIRAASFHHIDELLGRSFGGVRINWLLEMGSLLVIMGSTWRRRGQH